MIQLHAGGVFGAITGEQDRFVLIIETKAGEGALILNVGNNRETLEGLGIHKVEVPIDKTVDMFTLQAVNLSGNHTKIVTPNGVEVDMLRFTLERIGETRGAELPELIPSRAIEGGFSMPRKHFGPGKGQLIISGKSGIGYMEDDYLFSGRVDDMDEVKEFYESDFDEMNLVPIKAFYKLHYLKPRLDLVVSEYAGQAEMAGRLVDKALLDLSSLLCRFPLHTYAELPNQVVVKRGDIVVAMKDLDVIVMKQALLSGRYDEFVEMANVSFDASPDQEVYYVQLSAENVSSGMMLELEPYDGEADAPRLISYKDGAKYVIEAVADGSRAAIQVVDANDEGIEFIQVVDVLNGAAEFEMSENLVTSGMPARVSVLNSGWSPVSETSLQDITPDYNVIPQGINVSAKEREVSIGFDKPSDGRFAGTLLYHESRLVRNLKEETTFEVTALEPNTEYTFELAHYDIDGFESERVVVQFQTKPERTGPDIEPIPLYIDNIAMNFKI